MSASLQPNTNVSPSTNPNMTAINLSANVPTTNNVANGSTSSGRKNNGNNGSNGNNGNNSNGNRAYNNQPSSNKAQNQANSQASNEVEYVNISQEENPGNTINNNELEDSAIDTRMNGNRSNYNRNYDNSINRYTNRNTNRDTNRDANRNGQDPNLRRDGNRRVPTVTIKAETINNAQTRVFLEVVKGCFPTRLSDQAVIDGILAAADVDMDKLAQIFKSDFGDPIYIPEPGEDINVTLAKLQALQAKQSSQVNDSQATSNGNTLRSGNSNNANGNGNGNEFAQGPPQSQGRDLRVTLLSNTYRLLVSYQRELRREIYQEVDINALADKILSIGNYDTRAVVIAIRDYYQGIGKVQVGYSN